MNCRAARGAASRFGFRIALLSLLAALSAGTVQLHAQSAKSWYKQGQQAEAGEDFDRAFNDYQKAYSMSPKEVTYKAAFYRVQIPAAAAHLKNGRRLLATGDEQGALVEFIRASEIDPSDEAVQQQIAKVRALHKEQIPPSGVPESPTEQASLENIASPVQLRPVSNEPLTLHMVEDSKVIYQAVGKAAGVNVLFDPDYTGKRIQVDLTNVSLLDALRIVGTLSNTFWRPITTNTIFVAANTRSKRTELDEQAVQTFYLTNAWQQNDLQDVQTAIRNVLPNAHAYGVASQNAIVMRGTPDELLLAQKLVNDLDKARSEVVVDIAVLEVSKNWQRTLGIAWPQSASVQIQPPTASSSTSGTGTTGGSTGTSNVPTLFNLAHLNSNDFAVTIGQATANALLTDSTTKTLQSPRIRSTDGQKASMKIGSRIPIATGSFQSGVGVAAAVTPLAETQFQYIDIGVVIDMTPTVHYNGDVTMKLSIEVSSEGSPVTISGVQEPVIIQKKSEQTIRMRQGEASVLTGILNKQDIQSWSGIPGLSSIPILKYLFGSKDHQITDDEIVFLLVPHVVRTPDLTPANLQPVDTGTGQYTEIRRVALDNSPPSLSPIAQPARPSVEAGVGSVPGQSAQAAAPGALQQFRDSAQGNGPPPALNAAGPPAQTPPGGMRFSLVPSGGSSVAAGTSFQVPVVITGAKDITSVPLQVQYDASKLALMNVGDGDFLQSDGQAVALVHRDDGPGNIVINASRPPGAVGVSGAGVVCVLTFQAKTAGSTQLTIAHPTATTSSQQPVQAEAAQATIVVK